MIPRELETLKRKGLLWDNNTVRAPYKDAWITFSFLRSSKNLLWMQSIIFKWPLTRFYFIWRNEEYNNWSRILEFNILLLTNKTFKMDLSDFIKTTKSRLNFNDTQLNSELLKYKFRKFIISYSKAIVKEEKARLLKSENTL